MSDLTIELKARVDQAAANELPAFTGVYTNRGSKPLALTFWWNRNMRVVDAGGRVVAPGPGPVLPCGVGEEWVLLDPGASIERVEPMGCTQPAGRSERIGWSYELAPGTYRVALVFEAPPGHGFSQSSPNEHAFKGRVESNEISFQVTEELRKKGFLSRLLGRG